MRKHVLIALALVLAFLLNPIEGAKAQQTEPVVRTVLFYSPTCPHCEYVIAQTLPPLLQKYGEQLQIIGVNVSEEQGANLYITALDKFNIPQGGVPFLVIGDQYLIGSGDIPEKFQGLIETHLAQGGVDWPAIPGLQEAMSAAEETTQQESTPTMKSTLATPSIQKPAPTAITAAFEVPTQEFIPPVFELPEAPVQQTWQQKFAQDPSGNTLSIIVLTGMIGAVLWTGFQLRCGKTEVDRNQQGWLIPILCLVGFGVAGYLAYIETTQTTAVCGPVGDCNTVQQSEYARLFGVLPIGVMGLGGYVAIFLAWLVARFAKEKLAGLATLSVFGMAVFGTLFSIYLTFLEPFVIGATCVWCLTSAILITALMLLSLQSAKAVIS